MGKPLSEFLQAVHDETRTVHTGLYFKRSLTRQYATYSVARTLLAPGSRILSLGAGGAYPETALARFDHAVVEIAEFPEIIERLRPFYEKMNFRCHPVDLSVLPHFTEKTYDLVLSCDCIEHLPLVPEDHLAYCLRHTAPGGHTLVVTNNLASLRNIARLAMGRSILPPTRDRQRPVTAENEEFHRNEYTAEELRSAFKAAGFEEIRARMIWQNPFSSWRTRLFFPMEWVLPRLRPHQIVWARRPDR